MLGIAKPAVYVYALTLQSRLIAYLSNGNFAAISPSLRAITANDKRKVEFCGDGLTSAERAIPNEQLPTTEE